MALQATSIERCKNGYWTHPELPDFGETVSKEKLAEFESEQGFSVQFVYMDGDAPEEVHDSYFEKGSPSCTGWEPRKPDSKAFLLSIHDTEDGPVAWWAVPA